MKTLSVLLLLALCGCDSENQPNEKSAPISIYKDFIMGSPSAVANAQSNGSPPDGWDIVCDGHGNYAPRHGSFVVDITGEYCTTVRTSRFEAVVAAWRAKEIWDAPHSQIGTVHATNAWHDCPNPEQ